LIVGEVRRWQRQFRPVLKAHVTTVAKPVISRAIVRNRERIKVKLKSKVKAPRHRLAEQTAVELRATSVVVVVISLVIATFRIASAIDAIDWAILLAIARPPTAAPCATTVAVEVTWLAIAATRPTPTASAAARTTIAPATAHCRLTSPSRRVIPAARRVTLLAIARSATPRSHRPTRSNRNSSELLQKAVVDFAF
jgi:hypothetical protein